MALFTFPIIGLAGAPALSVYSLFNWGQNQPLLALPYGQSVCSIWTFAYGQIGPGAWLVCPVGGLQVLLTGYVTADYIVPMILAILFFLLPIFVLGNVFCGWACPVGTIIDSFDKSVERFMPKLNTKREERFQRSIEKSKANHSSAVCPIGITMRGMFHLKTLTTISGRMMPIILELWAIPVVAILASLREKRYFCRKICPVGASLNIAGSFNPLIKPVVKTDKCVMKECPKTCEDYHTDYCGACRQIDQKRCERVCPQGINLLDKGSLARCTKCFECYIQCDHDAIEIKLKGTPDAVPALKRLRTKLKRKPKKIAD